jgi:hypothetical protein
LTKPASTQPSHVAAAGTVAIGRFHIPGTISVTNIPASSSEAGDQITSVIEGDWNAWTGGANRNLTIGMVAALLRNPRITGSQAAVLGMIADQMYSDAGNTPGTVPSYSQNQALGYVLGTSNDPNAIFTGQAISFYTSAMSQIASSTLPTGKFSLYGTYVGPQLSAIQQGMLGDCFFLSAVDSVLNENPQLIAKLITQTATGAFVVRFPAGKVEVVRLTDGEIATFSQAAGNGAWLAVMGMAENAVLAGEPGVPACLRLSPLGLVSAGGLPSQTLHLLTGQRYSDLGSGNLNQYSLASIDQLLQQDLANNTPINIASQDHALSILGYNASTQTLTILNPWGVSGSYGANEDPGILNPNMEVQMVNGQFQLSLSNAVQDFYNITAPSGLVAAANSGMLTGARPTMLSPIGNTAAISIRFNNVIPISTGATSSATSPATRLPMAQIPSSSLTPTSLHAVTMVPTSNTFAAVVENVSSIDEVAMIRNAQNDAVVEETVFEAGEGSTLVASEETVKVHTARGTVQVAAHAAALLIQVDGDVAISNLCDNRYSDVTVLVDGRELTIPMGRTVLLSAAETTDANNIRLAECVEGDLGAVGRFGNSNAFMGMASYRWALKNCPQVGELMRSTDPAQRKMATRLMKTGAAMITLASGR